MMANRIGAALVGATLFATGPALAEKAHDHGHGHSHSHGHAQAEKSVYDGYFEDAQVAARPLADWAGDWQSVYPLLQSGALDPVMAHKAEHGDKSAAEYRAYYDVGYRTDVDRIVIDGDEVTFHSEGTAVHGHYASDGHEILTYEKGNRGVRYIFRKTGGDAAAPGFIQFSDHAIAPVKAGHYHLYWGDDRAALLNEVTNWPTYYPAAMSAEDVVHEMLAH
ncbi:metal-binding protein ZinT [Ruixingdingia sedimenti]|uniref:Metal-binding protein ZinT n=1 Tax=Ruixingdingia sedimenti TaxID=3073604 RepID=A0ABU1F6Q1_9RHOB|nr:metal-binding protein ZinT [Xinfangfangia sp. LG-4]MDR5652556.1 metal-binding protein ZinT [Xinfangfangia sp. LG-4]